MHRYFKWGICSFLLLWYLWLPVFFIYFFYVITTVIVNAFQKCFLCNLTIGNSFFFFFFTFNSFSLCPTQWQKIHKTLNTIQPLVVFSVSRFLTDEILTVVFISPWPSFWKITTDILWCEFLWAKCEKVRYVSFWFRESVGAVWGHFCMQTSLNRVHTHMTSLLYESAGVAWGNFFVQTVSSRLRTRVPSLPYEFAGDLKGKVSL